MNPQTISVKFLASKFCYLSLLIFSVLVLENSGLAERLYCQASGSEAIITKIENNVYLGTHYFSSMKKCQKAMVYAGDNVVCTSNAIDEFIPTRISDGMLLGRFYFSSLDTCTKATEFSRNGLICTNDDELGYYTISRLADNRTIGPIATMGFERCNKAVFRSSETKVCVFNEYGNYAPVEIASGRLLGNYSDLQGCIDRF